MGKPTQNVQIPGAPAAPAAEGAAPTTGEGTGAAADGAAGSDGEGASQDTAAADRIAALEAENRRLAAQVAAHAAQPGPGASLVFEADTPHGRVYKAHSKHLHLTSAELHAKVEAGEVKLTDHHVLCKDGWYVNPEANKQANG